MKNKTSNIEKRKIGINHVCVPRDMQNFFAASVKNSITAKSNKEKLKEEIANVINHNVKDHKKRKLILDSITKLLDPTPKIKKYTKLFQDTIFQKTIKVAKFAKEDTKRQKEEKLLSPIPKLPKNQHIDAKGNAVPSEDSNLASFQKTLINGKAKKSKSYHANEETGSTIQREKLFDTVAKIKK